jgi:redox-sensitive bicupin YhaK (pirin superfamily)
MIAIRRAGERGHADHGWLDTYHTFSFAGYYDPRHMGFRDLRVINEDRVQPGKGFPSHSHRDMEIFTWILAGSLEHKDSMGNGSVLRPGEAQRMSAGTGVTHSEFNASQREPVHLLQIWILPEGLGLPPSYEQKLFPPETRANRLCLLVSRDGREGSVRMHQDVVLHTSLLDTGRSLRCELRPGRGAWIQLARGVLDVQGTRLAAGDGAAIEDERELRIEAREASEYLLFDLL